MDQLVSDIFGVVSWITQIGMTVGDLIWAKNCIFPESVLFGVRLGNLIESDEKIVGSDLAVGIVLEIVADDKLRSRREFGFGIDVGRWDVMEGPEGFLMGVGDIGDIKVGLRVGEGVLSDFLLFHI